MPDDSPPPKPDPNLNALLVAQFDYITHTALGSNEDRARISNYYLVTTGAAVAAIVGARLDGTSLQGIYWGFSAVFLPLSLLGLFTLLTLIRLRAGWMDSAGAMNQITDYYTRAYPEARLREALRWTTSDLPPAGKVNSVAFWMAASAILIDSATAMAMVIYAGLATSQKPVDFPLLLLSLGVGLAFALAQVWLYFHFLPPRQSA
jgi:hypothetical protein